MKIQLNDIEVSYRAAGAGWPVVLIHGLAEDKRSWADVQDRLPGHRSYAVDLRGHGETSLGEPEGTLEQLGRDLIAFLEAVTGPAVCVGYSLGGTVVLWAAAQRPDLIRHCVVAGTSSVVGRAAAAFFAERIGTLQRDFDAFCQALCADTAAQLVTARARTDEVAARRIESINDGGGYINAARAMHRMAAGPVAPHLSGLTCGVDIVYGDQDVFCPEKAVDILAAALPMHTRLKVPGAGHLMSIDQPERYAEAIRGALEGARQLNAPSTEPG